MVDRSRIYPSIFILFFISFFYLVKSDFLFISILGLFIIYDLIITKILNFTFSFLLFILLFFSMVLFYFYDFLFINEVFLIFLVSLFFLIISKKYKNLFFSFSVFLILYLSFNILVQERYLFFFIISLSFTNDTLAFFSGKFFKGPLIVPKISPKKTWSGTLISIIFIFLILIFLEYDYLFSLLVSVSFFLGDILFSYFKRQQNIKDFSNLLKGHGGFLDRFDSIFFPIFLFNIYII